MDRQRGNTLNELHLYQIKLESYKISDVQSFVHRVESCLTQLPSDEINWKFLYLWLYEQFKRWDKIGTKIEKIKESRLESRKRTWDYLWGAIKNYLANYWEDSNYSNLAIGIAGGAIGGAPAKTTKDKIRTKTEK